MKFVLRNLVFAAVSFISLSVFAAENFDLTCVTKTPSTSFVVRDQSTKITLQMLNSNGVDFIPVHDGPITSHDLALIKSQAEVVKSLGTQFTFEWPKEKCQHEDDMIESCFGSTAVQKIGSHQVKAWGFDASQIIEKSFAGKFNTRKFSLQLDVDGKSYSIPMRYADDECTTQVF
jgi:hypothetical protein